MSDGYTEGRAYVAGLRAQGLSDAQIAAELRKTGWSEPLIGTLLGPPPAPPAGGTGLATAALVLGIMGLVLFPLGLIALILGLVAMAKNRPGREYALAGIVLGGVSIFVAPIMAAILFPVFARAREKALQTSCLSNVKQIMLAETMYATDYDNHTVPARDWPTSAYPYLKNPQVYLCPSDGRSDKQRSGAYPVSYAMSPALGGILVGDIKNPAETGVLFDGTQVFGGREAAATDRHNHGLNVGYADGHARWLTGENFQSLPLSPEGAGGVSPPSGLPPDAPPRPSP
jgi:prepilin-type processing-associated H-X9-DG protein